MKETNRNVKIIAGLLLIVICLGVKNLDAQTVSRAQTAAERRAKELVQHLGGYNPAARRKFIGENFTKSALERVSAESRFDTLARIYDRTRGLTVKEIRLTKPNEVTASATDKLLGENFELLVLVEENEPYQISGFGFRPQPNSGAPKKLTEKQAIAELDSYLTKLSQADVFSGAVLFAQGDRVLFEKAYGEANKDFKIPNLVDTKFNLGSMNKTFTAVAVAQLVEE